jgi:Flp pilus assembly protein TadG
MRGFQVTRWKRLAATVRRDERGTVLVVVAMSTLFLVGLASFAVDVSYYYVLRNQLQIAADSAALSALNALPNATSARAAARDYATKNMPAAINGTVMTDGDVLVGNWNVTTRSFVNGATPFNAVRVTANRATANGNAAPTFFANVLGFSKLDLKAHATAAAIPGGRPWDLVVAQDVTSSFSDEIADARAADNALLNCVNTLTTGSSLFGISLFTGVGLNYAALQTLQTGYGALTTKINAIRVCGSSGMPACSGTNIAAGLNTSVDMFLATPPSSPNAQRAIILVSDGEPNPANLKPAAITAANRAATNNISVFTVFYNRNNDMVAQAFLASLARGQGIALATPNASQLPTLLSQLCTDYAPPARMLVN